VLHNVISNNTFHYLTYNTSIVCKYTIRRKPDASWRRTPGRPRKTWISQIQAHMSARSYWDASTRRGHGRMTQRSFMTTRSWWWQYSTDKYRKFTDISLVNDMISTYLKPDTCIYSADTISISAICQWFFWTHLYYRYSTDYIFYVAVL